MSKCFAVASGKGGVGKSVLTANLAAALASNGTRVLIVDADIGLRSQDALLSLENRVVYDLIDVSNRECRPDQAVLSCESVPSLHLLPAAQFARAKELEPKMLFRIIRYLRPSYDYIFIDCPAGIERGLRNVLNAGVDETLLIVTPDDISIRSAERTAQLIAAKNAPRPRRIVNRLDSQLIRSGEMYSAATVSQVLDLQLLGAIPEDPAVYRSQLKHDLFIHYDCEARNAVLRIASRLQGRNVPVAEYGRKKNSFFRKMFSRPLKEVLPIDDH
ncbi:MAG: septum site-determining protein MinD [Clostridia bacterium]|nr:septum site-determining protein MinD [Clostridia bacterium]